VSRRKPAKVPTQRKVRTEAQQRADDMAAVNIQPESATLPRQADIEVTRAGGRREGQKVKDDTARRLDAFSALKDGMAQGCYDAARRFERDVLTRLGLGPGGQALGERVDCARGRVDAMVQAGLRVDEVNDRIPPRDFWLLMDLIAPRIDRDGFTISRGKGDKIEVFGPFFGWRAHTAYITGESNAHAQCAVIRAATVNLRDAYAAIERTASSGSRAA
jgi:hypothetical protein